MSSPHPARSVVDARAKVHQAAAVKYMALAEGEKDNDWRAVLEAKAQIHNSVASDYRGLLGFFEGDE